MGAIGKTVVKRLRGFDLNVLAYDVYYDEEFVQKYNIKKASIDEIVENADVITLHAPSIDDKPLIGKEEFGKMKKGMVLVNTARASLIDYNELMKSLDNKTVFAAGLDVHEHEPEYNEKLEEYDNVILTPHNAAITREATDKASMMAVDHILEFFRKENEQ